MPKRYSARVILARLQKLGFKIVHQKGSHIKLIKHHQNKYLTVIVPNHKEIAVGTFGSILKQASLTKKEFEE